jgi:DNA-binding transcriptional ArsR family regulator
MQTKEGRGPENGKSMKSNGEIHSFKGPGRPRGATIKRAEFTRLKIYDLYLKGFSEQRISESLGLDQSTISHHLSVMRKRNAEWFAANRDPMNRYKGLFKQAADMMALILHEAWLNYQSCPVEKFETRSNLLGRVNQSLEQFVRLLGISAPDLDKLFFHQEFETLRAEINKHKPANMHRPVADERSN